jgi:predicted esterase
MTHGEELVARWRCGSCENTHGALILLLHGDGSDEDALFDLVVMLPNAPAVAALRGPLAAAAGGFRWFDTDTAGRPVPASLRAAAESIERWIDEQAGDAEELWLAGIDTGATLVRTLLARSPQRYAGAALLDEGEPTDPSPDGGLALLRMARPRCAEQLRRLADWFSIQTTTTTSLITLGEHR